MKRLKLKISLNMLVYAQFVISARFIHSITFLSESLDLVKHLPAFLILMGMGNHNVSNLRCK